MDKAELKNIIESFLFVSNRPLSKDKILRILEEVDKKQVTEAIHELSREYKERGGALQILPLAGGYQLCTRPEYDSWIKRLFKSQTTLRLSPAALETLSVVAYKQPITKASIDHIRGVDSTHALHTLLKKKLVKITGKADSLGRPSLYGTTLEFLQYFGLENLSDIPRWEEIRVDEPEDMEKSSENV